MRGITFFTLLSAFVVTQSTPLAANLAAPPVIDYVDANKGDNGAISFGENARDGLYMSHNSTHFSYHGITAVISENIVQPPRTLDTRQVSCDTSCQGSFGNSNDINTAINGMKNFLGGGISYHGSVTYVINSAFAFGCDYGNGQTYNSNQYSFDVSCYQSSCGTTQGGWNSHHQWKSSYGVDIGSFSC